jgi:Flp pilus assembly protein CpaB
VATEVKQRNNRIIMVVLGLVLAAAAFGLSLYVSKSGSSTGTGTGTTQQVSIVVAKTDLIQGTQLTPDLLVSKPYSADTVPAGAVTDVNALLHKYLSVGVTLNTPITSALLVNDPASAKTAALSQTPLDLHAGTVAIAMPVSGGGGNTPELQTFGMYIQPEDHFDVLVDDGQGHVRYAFQDIRVLKVGAYSASGGGASVLVVEMTRAEAEAMSFLLAKSGQPGQPTVVKYVLRPNPKATPGPTPNYIDTAPFNSPGKQDNPVSAQTFNQLFPGH